MVCINLFSASSVKGPIDDCYYILTVLLSWVTFRNVDIKLPSFACFAASQHLPKTGYQWHADIEQLSNETFKSNHYSI